MQEIPPVLEVAALRAKPARRLENEPGDHPPYLYQHEVGKRLDVLVAVVSDETKQTYKDFTEGISEMYEDFTDSVSERFDHFEAGVGRRLDYLKDNAKALGDKMIPDSGKKIVDEIVGMTERYTNALKEHASFEHLKSKIKKFYIRSIIRSNPSMTSDEYKEALEELKSSTK